MSQQLIPITPIGANNPALANAFTYQGDKLTAGAQLGFPLLTYRGKVWRAVVKGTETPLLNADGDPRASISVVILDANEALSKIYYEKGYTEGDDKAPDCFSLNGLRPDPSVTHPQSATCDACPKAAWGSKVTDDGRELKACQDSRRMVVVPSNDLANEALGGPMLLRVPAASLGNLVAYDQQLKQANVAFYGVATRVKFDLEVAYPKLVFEYDQEASLALGQNQANLQKILELKDADATKRILGSMSPNEGHTPEDGERQLAKQPTPAAPVQAAPQPQAIPQPAPQPVQQPAAVATPPPAPAPQPQVVEVQDTVPVQAQAQPAAETGEVVPATAADVDSIVDSLLGGAS